MKPIYFILIILVWIGCKDKQPIPYQSEVNAIHGVGKIEPEAKIIELAPESSGKVIGIFVQENDSVEAASPLIELSNQSEKDNIAVVQAKITSQQALIAAQEANCQEADFQASNAQSEYKRMERLFGEGAATGQERDNAQTNWETKEAALQSARQALKSEQSKLQEYTQELKRENSLLDKRFIVAPANGTILSLDTQLGAYVAEGSPVIQFRPESPIIARCEIDELFASKVQDGQKAFLLSAGGIDTLGTGRVIFTGKFLKKKSLFYETAGEAEDRRVVEVKILPDNKLPLLLNSKVECAIQIKP